MARIVSGNWVVIAGNEKEFLKRWTEFLEWTKETTNGFHWARLVHDVADPQHYVSFSEWETDADVAAWRALPEFGAMLGATKELLTDFRAADYDEVVSVGKY